MIHRLCKLALLKVPLRSCHVQPCTAMDKCQVSGIPSNIANDMVQAESRSFCDTAACCCTLRFVHAPLYVGISFMKEPAVRVEFEYSDNGLLCTKGVIKSGGAYDGTC